MGRVGRKIKMKRVRKKLNSFFKEKDSFKFDVSDYDQLSELSKLKYIPNIYTLNNEDDFIKEVIQQVRQESCIEREMPDIEGSNFGIEHTEISPFYRNKNKGDSLRRYRRTIANSKRTIQFEPFDFYFLDLVAFLRKLGVQNESKLPENTIRAIKEKSMKFNKYEHFEHNGLWLDYPPFISFPNSNTLGYFLRDDIYQTLVNSPFDFFIIGNPRAAFILSKENLIKIKPAIKLEQYFIIDNHNQHELMTLGAKAKKKGSIELTCQVLKDHVFVTSDICFSHIWHVRFNLPHESKKNTEIKLYCDDLPASIHSLKEDNGLFDFSFNCEGFEGQIITDFHNSLNFTFNKVRMEAGESISLLSSQYNSPTKQKVLAGIKRLVFDQGNQIDIYISPPFSKLVQEDVKIFKVEETNPA